MKDIVDKAIPTLTPMNYGYWGNLSSDQSTILATWATLFTMSNEFIDKETAAISFQERNRFMRESIPSGIWKIAIGYGEPVPANDRTYHRAFDLLPDIEWDGHRKSQVTVFYFGRLLLFTYYNEFHVDFDFDDFLTRRGLVRIWPVPTRKIYKPFHVHDFWSVDRIIGDFATAIGC